MEKVNAMVLRNKSNLDRYLASSMEVGDWSDENLDVALDDIQSAYMIIRKDLTAPTTEDFEGHKNFHAEHKRRMIEQFGDDAFISMDFEGICEQYEPVNIEITKEQYDHVMELLEV